MPPKTELRNGIKMDDKCQETEEMLSNGKTETESQKSWDETEGKNQGLPIDRGWAWVVLGAAIFYFFLFGGVRKNFGLFFVAFQKRFNSSASVTSLLTTLQSIIISVSSLLVMTIGLHFLSCRTAIMIGGSLIATANVINALSTDIRILFASFGVIEAIGISMVHPPVTSMLGEYFSKKRGMANALAFSGASLGNLVFAPILTSLFENYGYTGTMFMVAGMTLNTCISGALMRPMNSFRKKGDTDKQLENIDEEIEAKVFHDNHKGIKHPLHIKDSSGKHEFSSLEIMPLQVSEIRKEMGVQLFRQHSYDPKRDPPESPLVPRQRTWSATVKSETPRSRTFSGHEQHHEHHHGHLHGLIDSLSHSKVSVYANTTEFYGSVVDVRKSVERTFSQTEDTGVDTDHSCCFSCKKTAAKLFKLLFDFSLLKNPVFLVFMLIAFLVHAGTMSTLVLIAPYSKDIGIPSDKIGILLSIVGCFDLIGRVTLAIISDRNYVKRTTILGVAVGTLGVVCQFVRLFTSFWTMVFFSIIAGSFCGLYQALHAVILVDYLGLPKLKSCLGFAMICHGMAMSVFFPVAGLIRDNTGTYVNSFHMLGGILLIGSAAAFCLPKVYSASTKTKEKDIMI